MNVCVLMGRLCADPIISSYQSSNGDATMNIARFTIAVDRISKINGSADFIKCVAYGKQAEFAEKFLIKGVKVALQGRIQTGSYTDKNGMKVYTTDIITEKIQFAESKASAAGQTTQETSGDGFLNVPDNIDEGLPFN